MRQKGCRGAINVHQMMYRGGGCALLQDELVPDKKIPPKPQYANGRNELEFDLDPRDALTEASLIVVDEASMISDEILRDLLPLGNPILALGDPAQLPPIGDDRGALTAGEPDAFLTEIHRSALDSPVIWLSMLAREGESLPWGYHGESCVLAAHLEEVCRSKANQILCGTNRSRRRINDEIRRIRGFEGWLPQVGERLVCLKNQHRLHLMNGSIWLVRAVETGIGRRSKLPIVQLELQSEDDRDAIVTFNCPTESFPHHFDFGY
jgi:AAA domain-containing protein